MKVEFIIGGTHLTASFGGAVMVGKLFTPRIGENGNWFVGDTDTGVSATKLPNALTFTGAASGVYDGSEPVEVEIPEEGNKVFFQEAEPEDAETGDFWYVEEEDPDTDTSQLSLLIETDMLPAVHDADGKILTDENGKIILRY